MDDQPTTLLDEPRLRRSVAVVERFEDLLDSVAWVEKAARRDGGVELSEHEWEVAVTVAGFLAAARQGAPETRHDWRRAAMLLLALWSPALVRRDDVNAPQVAAALLGGGWVPAPAGHPPPFCWWEPAGLVLAAMTYKSVHSGLHGLATKNVPPLAEERCQARARFDEHVWRATHTIAAWLTTPGGGGHDGPTIRQWRCEERSLWEFLSSAVLGPGRMGGGGCGGRPLPGAYPASLLGQWCEPAIGVGVGTIEAYACLECQELVGRPRCPAHPSAVVIATSCRNHFVTPRHRLSGSDTAWGYEQVERKTCHNGTCVDRLHAALDGRHRAAKPLYSSSAGECPYCRTDLAGQRPTTVWTRFP